MDLKKSDKLIPKFTLTRGLYNMNFVVFSEKLIGLYQIPERDFKYYNIFWKEILILKV